MVQVVGSPDPSAQAIPLPGAETDPFAGLSGMFSDMGAAAPAASGAGGGEIESLASDVITELATLSPETEASIAASLSALLDVIVDQLGTVDLSDPAAVAGLQSSFSQMFALSTNAAPSAEVTLLSGIADTAHTALTLASAVPAVAETAMDMVTSQYSEFSDSFDAFAAGTSDLTTTSEAALMGLYELYGAVLQMGMENGVELPSLAMEALPQSEELETDPFPEAATLDGPVDPLTGEPATDPYDPLGDLGLHPGAADPAVDPLTGEGSSEVDDFLSELGLDSDDPTADPLMDEETSGLGDLLGDDNLDPMDPTTNPLTGEETTDMDDLLEDYSLDPKEIGASDQGVDPLTGEPIVNPEDAADGLSKDSSTDGDPSAENQEALEARYIGLYESLMEKQIAFKEAIEPYKTDNQNAGKG